MMERLGSRRSINSSLFRDVSEYPVFSEPRLAGFPAAVTLSSAGKRPGRDQKVRKPLVFLDWEAIKIARLTFVIQRAVRRYSDRS